MAWTKCFQPLSGGGIGLRSMMRLNEATSLKVGWELLSSSENWAITLRNEILKAKRTTKYHIFQLSGLESNQNLTISLATPPGS